MAAIPKAIAIHVTGATGLVLKGLPGVFYGVNVNQVLKGVTTIKDGGTILAVLATGASSPIGPQLFMGPGGIAFASLNISNTNSSEDLTLIFE